MADVLFHKLHFSSGRVVLLVCSAFLVGLTSCSEPSRTENKLAQDISAAETFDSTLTLDNVTLEQANEKGEKLWKVESKKASYSKDQKTVTVESPKGELFQDGKLVYEIEAKHGEVHQDGQKIILKEKIVATDPQNGVVLRGNELEWRPKEDLLIVRNNLTGEHEKMLAVAKEAKVFSRQKRMELSGQVVATMKKPVVVMRTEHLTWLIGQEKLVGDRPFQIDQYKDKKVTESGFADESEFDLKTRVATLKKNAQLIVTEPPLQVSSKLMKWQVAGGTIESPGAVTVLHRKEKVVLTANQGVGDLKKNIFDLRGNVVGIGQKRQAQLNADRLLWYFTNQMFQAEGNVVFRQLEPPLNLTGPKATGQLKNETVVVSGTQGGQVVTEIVP